MDETVDETGATPSQITLAWLLARSPVVLPIPGTPEAAKRGSYLSMERW